MATFVLIHGGGSTAWDWHLVSPLLERVGHEVIAVDLPTEDVDAGFDDYVRAVVDSVGERRDIIVVGHSLGGFTAPLAAAALHAVGVVYLAGMIPAPGESFVDWWTNTGHDREIVDDDPVASFFNGVPEPLRKEALRRERDQQGMWLSAPWPTDGHPAIPTMAIACMDDRFFPLPFMERHIRERLNIDPVQIPGGHYATLSHPDAVAAVLIEFADEIAGH